MTAENLDIDWPPLYLTTTEKNGATRLRGREERLPALAPDRFLDFGGGR
jgi:hypothetical protein